MAKGPIITNAVEVLITSVYQKHPKWKAPEVRNEVRSILRNKNSKIPSSWPSISTVQKALAKVRKKMKEMPEDPLHKPWNMGTIDQYPIPPDTIPFVLKVWKLQEEKVYKFRQMKPPFDLALSIREAKWVSRLCHVIPDDIEKLSRTAAIYANWEELTERAGQSFNSTELDYDLVKPERPLPEELIAIKEQVSSKATQSREVKQPKSSTKEEVANKKEARNER